MAEFEKWKQSGLVAKVEAPSRDTKPKLVQEGQFSVQTDMSLKALKGSSSLEEVIDKMVKFREDIESQMTHTSNKIAQVAALEYKFDLFEKQINKLDEALRKRSETTGKFQDKVHRIFSKIESQVMELKVA